MPTRRHFPFSHCFWLSAINVGRALVFSIIFAKTKNSGYAASGIGLSALFQFYRAQPLWIPIGWNGLFMVINVSMIGLLLKERNDAGKLGDDPEQVCKSVYGEWCHVPFVVHVHDFGMLSESTSIINDCFSRGPRSEYWL